MRHIKYKTDNNGCWICTSHSLNNHGYPKITVNKVQTTVHRISYQKFNGVVDSSIIIRHTCDNKLCINPAHLIPGTHADNVRDRVERNRSATGSKNGRSKLTKEQVIIIRTSTKTKTELAKEYNVDRKVIYNIVNNKSWQTTINKS